MTKQAIIYTRFSPRPNAKECDSCEKQEERCLVYCRQQKYSVRGIYEDKNVTGGSLNRPALSEAIDSLVVGDILVVDSSDRLARDMLVNLTVRQQVADAVATIEFADGSPSDTTPEGKLFQNMLAAFAAYERDRIKLRCKLGHKRRRKNGNRTTGKIPIGWKLDPDNPKRLICCKEERNAILTACQLSVKGILSSKSIARVLTETYGLCRGRPWSDRTIRKLIKHHAFWADPIDGDLSLEPKHP